MPNITFVRGTPGTGKSTLARRLPGEHYEADQFFVDSKTGIYTCDPDRLPEAHAWCFSLYERALWAEKDVVISNTFNSFRRLRPYIELLRPKDLVTIIECTGPWESEHSVPPDVLKEMKRHFENKDSILNQFASTFPKFDLPNYLYDKDLELYA